MAAFELKGSNSNCNDGDVAGVVDVRDQRRLREECIIALKVYDSCRQQDCLTQDQIGPARAAECICIGDEHINEGDVIDPANINYDIHKKSLLY